MHEERFAVFLRQQLKAYEEGQRALVFLIPVVVLLLGLPFSLFIPGATEVTGLRFATAMVINGVLAVFVLLTTAAYHLKGPEAASFRLLDVTETWVFQIGIGAMIASSGHGDNFYWFCYLVHVLAIASRPVLSWKSTVPIVVVPLGITLWFFAQSGVSINAIFPLVVGLLGIILFVHGVGLQRRVLTLAFERSELQAELAGVQVMAERARIARDLHDGVTADLTAMAWRAEELAVRGETEPTDLKELGQRARAAIDDTRAVVWALEGKPLSWSRLCDQIDSRCRQLCSRSVRLILDLQTECRRDLDGALALDIVRLIQEAVRNALQHAEPSRLRVALTLGAGDIIAVDVEDDGVGLSPPPGKLHSGLRNLRERVAGRGGELSLNTLDPGTRVSIRLPWPQPE